jgi:hypothetical protein
MSEADPNDPDQSSLSCATGMTPPEDGISIDQVILLGAANDIATVFWWEE